MGTIMEIVSGKDPYEKEFQQAVHKVAKSVKPVLDKNSEYRHAGIMERMVEPKRVIMFRVNRGFRIQMNSAIGPCIGELSNPAK